MRRRIVPLLLLAGVAAGALALSALGRSSSKAHAGQGLPAGTPRVVIAIIATPHVEDARASVVRFLTIDAAGTKEEEVASLAHAPGAVLRGDMLRDRDAAVIALDDDGPRSDFGSALYRVERAGTKRLAGALYHASRPLASISGAVYAERGAEGPELTANEANEGRLRTDALRIDGIDPQTGASKTLHTFSGYTLHLAGEWRSEVVVYRVSFDRAEIVAIDRASGATRVVAEVPPFARDFSIDEARGALLMSNRDAKDSHLWAVESLDLTSGATSRIASQRDEALAPFALPGRRFAWSAPKRLGLMLKAPEVDAKATALQPLGPGFEAVTGASSDGAWITIRHVPSSGAAIAAAVHLQSGKPVELTSRAERVGVLGFLGGGGAGAR